MSCADDHDGDAPRLSVIVPVYNELGFVLMGRERLPFRLKNVFAFRRTDEEHWACGESFHDPSR